MYINEKYCSTIVLNDIKNEEMAKSQLYGICDYIIDTSIRSRIVKDRNGVLDKGEENYIDNVIGAGNIVATLNLRDGENEVITATQRPRTNNGVHPAISEMLQS